MIFTANLVSMAYDWLISRQTALVPGWVSKNPKFHRLEREFHDIRHGFRKLRADILRGHVREEEARLKGWHGRLRTANDARDQQSKLFCDNYEGPYPVEAQRLLNLLQQESQFILDYQLKSLR
jgi:hypothetical protein